MCEKTLPSKSEAAIVGPESRIRENMLKITIHWLIKFDMIAPSVFETVAKSTYVSQPRVHCTFKFP